MKTPDTHNVKPVKWKKVPPKWKLRSCPDPLLDKQTRIVVEFRGGALADTFVFQVDWPQWGLDSDPVRYYVV